MHLISLDDAVTRIRQGCEHVSRRGAASEPSASGAATTSTAPNGADERQRFFFIVGAGISSPSIPLAGQMVLANLVVTPNFDDFLTRSLQLLGHDPIVCDYPLTAERIDLGRTLRQQVLHVHGTYSFNDCCNLKGEIEARAATPRGQYGMGALLAEVLRYRAPLVVGYSGWEGDVIMTALADRLKNPSALPYCLYWFCHRRSEVDTLPAWLKERGKRTNGDVCFVVPAERKRERAETGAERTAETRAQPEDGEALGPAPARSAAVSSIGSMRGDDDEPQLDAMHVFDALIRGFELDAPELVRDPLGFFAKRLQGALPKPNSGDPDVYTLSEVIERIETASGCTTQRKRGMPLLRNRPTLKHRSSTKSATRCGARATATSSSRCDR